MSLYFFDMQVFIMRTMMTILLTYFEGVQQVTSRVER